MWLTQFTWESGFNDPSESPPYFGMEAESVVFRCKKCLFKPFMKDRNVQFRIHFKTRKLSFFTSNKDTPIKHLYVSFIGAPTPRD